MPHTPDLHPDDLIVRFLVEAHEAGQRLDSTLAGRCPNHSRSRLAQWIKEGRVSVAGKVAKKSSTALAEGAEIVLRRPAPPSNTLVPTEMEISVIYEDEALLVVDKAAGRVMHPGPGHPDDTLVNGLLARYGELSPVGLPARPGVVHRIDADTTGLVVVARTEVAHNHLAAQFAAHTVRRRYRALVWGKGLPESGTLSTLYARHPNHRVKFSGQVRSGKQATTHFKCLAEAHGCTWMELQLETGRTHQIRVHMSERGWPLLGDPLYGRPRRIERPVTLRQRGIDLGLRRQALHAFELGFEHPTTGEPMHFVSPLPEDIAAVLELLGITP